MTTYSISLDDVDLALLPMRTRTYNDFLKKEYYQFQVFRETPQETSSVTYTCHICATDVPTAFASEHIASVKHQANTKIAKEAIHRMSAGISSPPLAYAARSSARFCANCASVVDDNHEKTKEHRVAAMHDNLLWELMKAYVGDGETINNNVTNEDQDKCRINKDEAKIVDSDNVYNDAAIVRVVEQPKLKTGDTSEVRDNQEINKKDETNSGLTKTNRIENNQAGSSVASTSRWVKLPNNEVKENGATKVETEKETNKNIVTNGQIGGDEKNITNHYEKELRKFMDSDNSFEISEAYNRMHIKSNDVILNVYSDNFHSYHRIYTKDRKIECVVCDCIFSQKEDESHKYDLNHMSLVAKIGTDGHYVRKINNSYSHCILCNQKIRNDNIATHKKSQHHSFRKSNNVKANKTKDNHTGIKKEVTTNGNTDDNAKIKEKTTNDTEVSDKIKGNAVNYPYEEVYGDLRCIVCDCRVPKDQQNRQDHVKGLRHVNNLK